MGLDVTFYRNVSLVRAMTVTQANAEDYDPGPRETLFYKDHPSRTQNDDLVEGSYSYQEEMSTDGYSYGGYNRWRGMLAQMLGTTAKEVWANPKPGPFVELIHFSDSEGFMGPKTCAKLARDFADMRGLAVEFAQNCDHGAQFLQRYDEWARGFAWVGDQGAVQFH